MVSHFFAMNRVTLAEGRLADGTIIPQGFAVVVNAKNVHMDPEKYPNPQVFDMFRFSKMRDDEESSVRHDFTTLDKDFLPFGAGRHACPGRFFAAMELKIILAQLLLNYDFSLPPNTSKPKNKTFQYVVIPDTKAKISFRPRVAEESA